MIEIGLHGIAAAGRRILVGLGPATDPRAEFTRAAIGDVRDLPGDRDSPDRS